MNPTYQSKIQEWVKCDNQLLHIKDQANNVAERKKVLESEILDYVTSNNMKNLTINISDGVIKFASVNSKSPLTRKNIKSSLEEFSSKQRNIGNIDEIVDYMFNNLEVTNKVYIKRDLKKPS